MEEVFLHYVWRAKRFNVANLKTTQGEPVCIFQYGHYNTDSGPDFKHAKIRIGGTLWAGHIEMHLKSSDWVLHNHHKDQAYENVILHVVLEEDQAVFLQGGTRIPCLVLKDYIQGDVITNYQRLQYHEPWVPCQKHLPQVPMIHLNSWLDRMILERLDQKADQLRRILDDTNSDWEESFYIWIARSFGLYQNTQAFEMLAKQVPLKLAMRHQDQPFQIEALYFGCSGMLKGKMPSGYPTQLKKEFQFLRKKYELKELNPSIWQFFRMRPAHFPTIRIAQFTSLLIQPGNLLQACFEMPFSSEFKKVFEGIKAGSFWNNHYHFHKESPAKEKRVGKTFIDLLIINAICPFLYLYGKEHQQQRWIDKSMDWICSLAHEKNSVTRNWKEVGISAQHAGHSQALVHLKKSYCDQRLCLSCAIGHSVLSTPK